VIAAASSGPSPLWFATRATGLMAMILLSACVVLGILVQVRFVSVRWPRFLTVGLHRNLSLMVLVFVVLHVGTTVADSYTSISLLDAVLPFASSYRPFWLGLGAVAFDLLLALAVTSLLRVRLGHRAWRLTHWASYACWPIAVVHGLGTGSDPRRQWVLALTMGCVLVVLSAFSLRLAAGWPDSGALRLGAAIVAITAVLAGGRWAQQGPMQADWSRRSGTPPPAGDQSQASPVGQSTAGPQAVSHQLVSHPSASRQPSSRPTPSRSPSAAQPTRRPSARPSSPAPKPSPTTPRPSESPDN
jgi:hypothetical protein